MTPSQTLDRRLTRAVQAYWDVRGASAAKQQAAGKSDAGSRGQVTGGQQMAALEGLVADILCEAGMKRLDIKTRTSLELPGHFRATKKWDLLVVSGGRLVAAMELKSQAGKSIGNNINNRAEEAVGSAKDLWTAYREGRFGTGAPAPFLGFVFLLEDRDSVKQEVANKQPYFAVDPVFSVQPGQAGAAGKQAAGVSYSQRYALLCRRLMLERLYTSTCLLMATHSSRTRLTQPAEDLSFARFVAALRGHALTFLEGSRP